MMLRNRLTKQIHKYVFCINNCFVCTFYSQFVCVLLQRLSSSSFLELFFTIFVQPFQLEPSLRLASYVCHPRTYFSPYIDFLPTSTLPPHLDFPPWLIFHRLKDTHIRSYHFSLDALLDPRLVRLYMSSTFVNGICVCVYVRHTYSDYVCV